MRPKFLIIGRPDRQIALAMLGLALLWGLLGWWVSL